MFNHPQPTAANQNEEERSKPSIDCARELKQKFYTNLVKILYPGDDSLQSKLEKLATQLGLGRTSLRSNCYHNGFPSKKVVDAIKQVRDNKINEVGNTNRVLRDALISLNPEVLLEEHYDKQPFGDLNSPEFPRVELRKLFIKDLFDLFALNEKVIPASKKTANALKLNPYTLRGVYYHGYAYSQEKVDLIKVGLRKKREEALANNDTAIIEKIDKLNPEILLRSDVRISNATDFRSREKLPESTPTQTKVEEVSMSGIFTPLAVPKFDEFDVNGIKISAPCGSIITLFREDDSLHFKVDVKKGS